MPNFDAISQQPVFATSDCYLGCETSGDLRMSPLINIVNISLQLIGDGV